MVDAKRMRLHLAVAYVAGVEVGRVPSHHVGIVQYLGLFPSPGCEGIPLHREQNYLRKKY